MEDWLLVLDELDDAVATARHMAPRLIGFFAALALFALTVVSFMFVPRTTLAILGVLLSASLLERMRRHILALAKLNG